MAAGDKNKAVKSINCVWHFSNFYGANPLCDFSDWGYMTDDLSLVDCKRCLKLIQKQKLFNNEEPTH